MYYQSQPSQLFLKIVLAGPSLVAACRSECLWEGTHLLPCRRLRKLLLCLKAIDVGVADHRRHAMCWLCCFLPAGLFEQGISLKWLSGQYFRSTTYESNVPYALRFMIDCSVVGGNWVELPAGAYSVSQHQVGGGLRQGTGTACKLAPGLHLQMADAS